MGERELQRCDSCTVFESDDAAHALALELATGALATLRRSAGERRGFVLEAVRISRRRVPPRRCTLLRSGHPMTKYFVQDDDEVAEYGEDELRSQLGAGELTGLELVRREGEEHWRPLHELPVFPEVVPHAGDPRNAARRRVAKSFAWHLLVYGVLAGGLFGLTSWISIAWGVLGLLPHALKALPPTWALVREGKLLSAAPPVPALPPASVGPTALLPAGAAGPGPAISAATPEGQAARPEKPEAGSGDALARATQSEAQAVLAEVRSMLESRSDASATELDRIADTLQQLEARIERLSGLLATQDRTMLEERLAAARQALDRADQPDDRALRRQEVEVLGHSVAASERAEQALERLRLREHLALQQLQQLRLELVRSEVEALDLDDVGERLDEIRIQAEATDEAEALVSRGG